MVLSIAAALEWAGVIPTKILSGGAEGIDTGAIIYAQRKLLPCGVRRPKYDGTAAFASAHNKLAPKLRNQRMVDEALADPDGGALVAIWDGLSGGTADIVCRALAAGLPVHVKCIG
jgi:hypothetical protein